MRTRHFGASAGRVDLMRLRRLRRGIVHVFEVRFGGVFLFEPERRRVESTTLLRYRRILSKLTAYSE